MIGNFLSVPRHNKNIWHFLAEKTKAAGWEVITASPKNNQYLRMADMLLTIWKERKRYRLAQVDVFSGKAFIFAFLSSELLRILKKTVILNLHGGGLPEFCSRNSWLCRHVLKHATLVATPSPFLQNSLHQFRPEILLIPNPVDLSEAIFRLRTDVRPIMVWVRAFHEVYNPSLIVKVLQILKTEFPEIKSYMIGPDKGDGSLPRMLNLAAKLGMRDQIEVVGPISHEEIPTWLDKADIFINTTNYDTAPRSLLEGMANGLCVVSTDVGGISFLVERDKEGILVPPNDAPAMAVAIRRVLTEPGLAQDLSQNARRKAEAYDWSVVLPQWLTVYSNLLNTQTTESENEV